MSVTLIAVASALLAAIVVFASHRRWTKKRERWFAGKVVTEGTVVRCDEKEDFDYWSAIEYPAGRQRYQITGYFGYGPADVGRSVPVAYDPSMPSEARLVEEPTLQPSAGGLVFTVVFVFGIIFIVAMTVRAFLAR